MGACCSSGGPSESSKDAADAPTSIESVETSIVNEVEHDKDEVPMPRTPPGQSRNHLSSDNQCKYRVDEEYELVHCLTNKS